MAAFRENFLTGYTILVIDDEPDGIRIAELLLKRHGAKVLSASNGRLGLERAQQDHPDLIISDLSMPGMDGWKMVAAIKEDPTIQAIPVIALTAHVLQGERDRVIAAGFHNYMSKPLMPRTFIQDLMEVLRDLPQFAALAKGD